MDRSEYLVIVSDGLSGLNEEQVYAQRCIMEKEGERDSVDAVFVLIRAIVACCLHHFVHSQEPCATVMVVPRVVPHGETAEGV